ncbi:MAG: hypothetical protein AAF442_05125 [Pseudomonadota bacterium]
MISLAQIKAWEWFLLHNLHYDIVATIEDEMSHGKLLFLIVRKLDTHERK